MFAFALVILPFSDLAPAEAIQTSLARYRRGQADDVPDEWLAFDDLTPFLREAHEAIFTFSHEKSGSLQIRGSTQLAYFLDSKLVLAEMDRRGLEVWTVRFANEIDLDGFCANFCRHKRRDSRTGLYGIWLNGLGRWDWWDLGGRFDGWILGERRVDNSRSTSRISSGDNQGRQILANVENAVANALGQEPSPTIDVAADRNIEIASTALETLRAENGHKFVGAVVLPPGTVDDTLRWMDTWPVPRPSDTFTWLGLASDCSWAEVVEAALSRFPDHWVAGVAYHL